MTYRVLTVCTGNICRSPAAAQALSKGLGPSVEVSSAGSQGLTGRPIEPKMADLLLASGVPTVGFAARYLSPAMVSNADLVLALTREHRSFCVELAPVALRRTFTLLEFAHLLTVLPPPDLSAAASPADRLREWKDVCARGRATAPAAPSYDVPDPYGQDDLVYRTAWDQIESACATIIDRCAS